MELSREHEFVKSGDRKLKVGVELRKDEILQFSKDYKDIFSQSMKDMRYISREITEYLSRVILKDWKFAKERKEAMDEEINKLMRVNFINE